MLDKINKGINIQLNSLGEKLVFELSKNINNEKIINNFSVV